MSAYLSLVIDRLPLIGGTESKNEYLLTKQERTPKLKYITIYNPDFVTGKGELNEELAEQVFCFITDNSEGDESELNKVEQIRTIGLIQAMDALASEFNQNIDKAKIIKASKSTIIVKTIEGSFRIACSISMPEGRIKRAAINRQMIGLLDKSYKFFKIFNTSFQSILQDYNPKILRNLMREHWRGFLINYNSENFMFPVTVKWPNSLNYKGFLGFFETECKKSSIEHSQDELKELMSRETPAPKGVIISCFDKTTPKKYGLIHFDNNEDGSPILKEELIDIHNYLEYLDYHEKFNSVELTKLSNDDLFSSPQSMKANINTVDDEQEEQERNFFKDSANYAIDILNPINLTNNLVILPLNYTMNSMMNVSLEAPRADWFRIPSYLRLGTNSNEEEAVSVEEDPGKYVVGLVGGIVQRKLVYLTTGEDAEEREYLIIVYVKNNLAMTLIYDSSLSELDSSEFYDSLRNGLIVPTLDEVHESVVSDPILESSIGSLPNGEVLSADQIADDFFFVIYDAEASVLKSSLPYLPLPMSAEEINQTEKSNLNLRSVMFYLHDQLTDLFFLQETDFFRENSINEFFHKFTTNKINDWLFYYIKYKKKYIIIIKNSNHNYSKKKKKLLSQIRPSASRDFKFLENLGDDVRLWFENYITNGTT